ncbi:MerR family transcriptional regulator [Microlunatus sp. Y2014]|uniref:MerR family transcriptional regulator n=1 Tax=Microlunatus sp. Y2014 TaxID=3418488 RepID=UPI003DA78A36
MSELSARSGVPVATIKYYLREGLLSPGERTSRTQATYGEEHVRRLGLVRALVDSAGLSLARTKEVLAVVDRPMPMIDLLAMVTRAGDDDVPRPEARALADALGWQDVPTGSVAMERLQEALAAMAAAGFRVPTEAIEELGERMGQVAEVEVAGIPTDDAAAAAEYVLVGTALVAPVLLALREVGHIHHSFARFGTPS